MDVLPTLASTKPKHCPRTFMMPEVHLKGKCSTDSDKMPVQEQKRREIDVRKPILQADWLLRTRQRLHVAKTRRQEEFADLLIVADSIVSARDGGKR